MTLLLVKCGLISKISQSSFCGVGRKEVRGILS